MLHETVKVVFRNTLMYIIKLSKSWYNVDRQPYHGLRKVFDFQSF